MSDRHRLCSDSRLGDGVRLTAGIGFTDEEEYVMYPQWTVHNDSILVAYSQGMVARSAQPRMQHVLAARELRDA